MASDRWLLELSAELEERIAADRAANARVPRLLTVRNVVPHIVLLMNPFPQPWLL